MVYNHTGEGNQMGPTLCFRGLDNVSYYRVVEKDRRYYMDYTGCGNTLDMTHPRVLQMIMDSLRFWVEEMRVDGFRFDLASTLARERHDVDRACALLAKGRRQRGRGRPAGRAAAAVPGPDRSRAARSGPAGGP